MIRSLFIISFWLSLILASQKVLTNQTLPNSHGLQLQKNFQQPPVKSILEEQAEESNGTEPLSPQVSFILVNTHLENVSIWVRPSSILSSWFIQELFLRGPPSHSLLV